LHCRHWTTTTTVVLPVNTFVCDLIFCIINAGYGVSDVENLVDCKPASVMRIASISKPMTMVAIAWLWEQGKLDLDKPVQHYVPSWPEKVFKGKKV